MEEKDHDDEEDLFIFNDTIDIDFLLPVVISMGRALRTWWRFWSDDTRCPKDAEEAPETVLS